MIQHSPGPWECVGFENLVVNDEEGNTITCAPGGRYGATLGELRANARLIAAAPDLLSNARALVQFLIENDERWHDNQFVLDLQESTAKAEGRA